MRNYGTRFECLQMRPHDHIGWTFAGQAEFAALARPFLAEGAARGERLMYVAEDPDPAAVAGLGGPGAVLVASIAEVYGAAGIVDAPTQRATFAAALADALAEGYNGIRVAADNTPLVADETRVAAWIRWEIAADRFMSENLVTGLCAFDRQKVNVDRLRHLATLHPLSPASHPVPQFRIFADAGDLSAEGELDSFAVSQLRRALAALPPGTGVRVDLAAATLRGRNALASLGLLSDDGVSVTIRGEPAAIGRLRLLGPLPSERLILQEAIPH
jgi:MEDS: MEthanogen/methylotroph, DcmR Sensory domain